MALDTDAAAEEFWIARGRREYFPAAYADRLSLDDAYRIQLALIDRRVAAGEHHIGWKVGLTAKAIQEQFGFHEPVFGCILQSFPSDHELPSNLIKLGLETELCMRFARSLEGEVTPQQVLDELESVHPSFEIIETRGDLTRHIALAIADNAQQHSVILGTPMQPNPTVRLDQVVARITLNNKEIAMGTGDAVLGNPFNSVVWLAHKLTEFGRSIRPGDVVMTGSFVRQFPLAPGDEAEADFSNRLGSSGKAFRRAFNKLRDTLEQQHGSFATRYYVGLVDGDPLAVPTSKLTMRTMRRTCVTLNFDAGVPPNLIGGITGHSPDEINDILAHYRARTADQAAAALELRMAHEARKGTGAALGVGQITGVGKGG